MDQDAIILVHLRKEQQATVPDILMFGRDFVPDPQQHRDCFSSGLVLWEFFLQQGMHCRTDVIDIFLFTDITGYRVEPLYPDHPVKSNPFCHSGALCDMNERDNYFFQ